MVKKLTFIFPGVRAQHVDRINSIRSEPWCTVSVYHGHEQTYQAEGLNECYQYIGSIWQLLTQLMRNKSDVYFIAGWYHRYCITAILIATIKRVPICYMSESTLHEESRKIINQVLKSILMRQGRSFLVGGQAQEAQIRKYVKNQSKSIYFGYNSNSTMKFLKFKKAREYNLFVGRLTHKKNLRLVIDSYHLLAKKNFPLKPLRVVGDGPLRQELLDLIKAYDLSDLIHLVGVQTGDQLVRSYRQANFTIIPSIYEQWGFVANESLASGTPILVSQFAGCYELCKFSDKVTGIVFDPTSAKSLSNAIMIADELDYNKISHNALSLMETFSCEKLFRGSVKKIVENIK